MRFSIDELNVHQRSYDTLSLLESMPRIDRAFSKTVPASIPIREVEAFGESFMVKYSDIQKLAQEEEVSIQEAIDEVTHFHRLRQHDIIVSLEEWRPYANPNILYEFTNEYVLVPEIDTSAYKLCDMCMTAFLESGDFGWIDFYINCPEFVSLNENALNKDNIKEMMAILRKQHPDWDVERLNTTARNLLGMSDRIDAQVKKTTGLDYSQILAKEKEAIENNRDRVAAIARDNANKRMQELDQQQMQNSGTGTSFKEIVAKQNAATYNPNNTENTNNQNSQTQASSDQQQSWLSKKWAALKNWWNNAGQAKEDGTKAGWFSNLVGKIKNVFKSNSATSTTTNNNSNQTQQQEPAKPAPVETKQEKEKRVEEQKAQTPAQTENKTPATTQTPAPANNNNNKT